jgi:SagB-type dehydrogenase family enzyme
MDPIDVVIRYHEETKHNFGRYARSLGYLDWDNQPNPFRRFAGTQTTLLPLSDQDSSPAFSDIYRPGAAGPAALNATTIGWFLEYALGLSAWKEYRGSRWALRCNPSSGNLHPTEGYVILPQLDGLAPEPGVYHYAAQVHGLERRASLDLAAWSAAMSGQPPATFLVGLTSVVWREAWKYGERAFRYCQHDVGHAIAALAYSAAALGWRVVPLQDLADDDVARLLGLDRAGDFHEAEDEHPDVLVAVVPTAAPTAAPVNPSQLHALVDGATWYGQANRLSEEHAEWPIIDEVAGAARKSSAPAPQTAMAAVPHPNIASDQTSSPQSPSAWTILRQRRSAVSMDGKTSIDAPTFFTMLARTMPGSMPCAALGPPAYVHLLIFAHRVTGLAPGLYILVRDPAAQSRLRAAMNGGFKWQTPAGCPTELPLFLLLEGDARETAAAVSCGQAIAGEGAFSLGMCAEFEPTLRQHGAWVYRRLFWETGLIGQVLYLEAEAAGVRATGIGCFFDDPVHGIFGLRGHDWQSLYHFTVGGAIDDTRLTTLPPYDAARRAQTADGRPLPLPQ